MFQNLPNSSKSTKRNLHNTLSQSRGLQNVAYRIIDGVRTEIETTDWVNTPNRVSKLGEYTQVLSSATRIWETAVDRVRILEGRPMPGSMTPADRRFRASQERKPRRDTEPRTTSSADDQEAVEPEE
jgi:hypothetical protein